MDGEGQASVDDRMKEYAGALRNEKGKLQEIEENEDAVEQAVEQAIVELVVDL